MGVRVPYALRVVVETSNLEGNPAEYVVQVAPGVIKEIIAQFPTGCNGAVHAVLEDSEGQVAPHQGGNFALSGGAFPFQVSVPISPRQPVLRLAAWADPGNTRSHVIDFIVTVEHGEAF